jgi:hypothetical protein
MSKEFNSERVLREMPPIDSKFYNLRNCYFEELQKYGGELFETIDDIFKNHSPVSNYLAKCPYGDRRWGDDSSDGFNLNVSNLNGYGVYEVYRGCTYSGTAAYGVNHTFCFSYELDFFVKIYHALNISDELELEAEALEEGWSK